MAKKILFLPFLQIPSGHHQVADALIDGMMEKAPEIRCEKVDILSYSYGKMEWMISNIYLKWIHAFPNIYNFIYKTAVYKNIEETKRYWLYESLFVSSMKRLVEAKKPDLIVCTHALPAYMLNLLKCKDGLNIPVINVYTDYFIHRFWGVEYIDYHFIPSPQLRGFLNKKGISNERIFNTGIPIHFKITKIKEAPKKTGKSILISGGNMGVGSIEVLINKIIKAHPSPDATLYVLCGKNKKLYEKLQGLKQDFIRPLPYIDCRDKMNALYEKVDAVLTKPGGVTISECLFKRKPIIIYDALPGQEEINLKHLKDLGLVFNVRKEEIPESIFEILQNQLALKRFHHHVSDFHSHLETKDPTDLILEVIAY